MFDIIELPALDNIPSDLKIHSSLIKIHKAQQFLGNKNQERENIGEQILQRSFLNTVRIRR